MKPKIQGQPKRPHRSDGFALVVSLTLMVLLTVLVVGLLGLSSVALRTGTAGEARAEAQANARLALTLALGELQSSLGPDQRVSARASSIAGSGASEANLTGAWKSWRWSAGGGDPDHTGRDYGDKSGRFEGWLVSTRSPVEAKNLNLPNTSLSEPVWMLNPSKLGLPDQQGLRATKVPLGLDTNRPGAFAWAVMDESQKAPIRLPEQEVRSDGERLARRIAPARAYPEAIDSSLSLDSLGDVEKLVSLDSAVVAIGGQNARQVLSYQHDVTPYSLGLLANVAEGGLKTDLTAAFESSDNLANVMDSLTPYQGISDPSAPTWEYLRSHYQLYRKVQLASSGTPVVRPTTADLRPDARGVGITPAPASERLMPVIAKLQIMFSVVTHHAHIGDRVNFFNQHGGGNNNYACPHLVYDPVVTLYNPYDIAIELQRLRVRVWDPPVVFGFKKNNDWLRDEFSQPNGNGFHGLARFQIANERNPNARRTFTLVLGAGNANGMSGRLRLEPGEVKVLAPRVQTGWTWGVETQGGYTPGTFFDWDAGRDFGNKDPRSPSGNGQYGVESVPGWDPRAGLQTDHLSYSSRPEATRYDFERQHGMNGGWLAIRLNENFSVSAKPGRTVTTPNVPDFTVDLLAGSQPDPTRDILRSYRFRFADPSVELSANSTSPIIQRTFRVGDLLQAPGDATPGGKSPFAILTMAAKTTIDQRDNSMPWLHNHPVIEGAEQDSMRVGNALDSYDIRVDEVADFNVFPGIEMEPGSNRGFYGASLTSNRGVSNVPMFRVPLVPAASLGDLIPANLVSGSNLPRVTHPFGNSRAHPLIPTDAVTRPSPAATGGLMLDHSYLLNDALWDRYFFSTAASYDAGLLPGRSRGQLLRSFFNSEERLLNARFVPVLLGRGSSEEQANSFDSLGATEFSRRIASSLAIDGPFNVNSDSVEAWKAMLSSLREAELLGWGKAGLSPKDKTAFPRAGFPIAGDAEASGSATIDVQGQVRWAGFRALTDEQIVRLAEAVVEEIRARGSQDKAPSLTMGEFVNRRLGSSGGLHVLKGLLETAIEKSRINDPFHQQDSKLIAGAATPEALAGIAAPAAREGLSGEGAPSMLTQGDLLMALAPVITVRGDTFRIRAYGESRNNDGEVLAKAWCEAIVQRMPEYLDPSDDPELRTSELRMEANKRFGRKFSITSFRWLSPEEV